MFQHLEKSLRLIWVYTVLCTISAFALNPIHESGYSVLPRGKMMSDFSLGAGMYFDSPSHDVFYVPLAATFAVSNRLELGGGLKTAWGDADNNIPYMVFGLKYLAESQLTLGADLIIGTQNHAQKGLTLNFHQKLGYTSRFYARFAGELGFMDYNVRDDALMAFELAYYPTLRIVSPISLQFGFIGSSQSKNFERNLAMDLQPGLIVDLGRESSVETLLTFGLAGNHKEDLRVKVAFVKGF